MGKILVTGATGFIGWHVVKLLTSRGHEVRCLVRETSNRQDLEPFDIEFVVGDINDTNSLERCIADVDTVYHLAGLTKSFARSELFRVNQEGTRNVANACAAASNPPLLLMVSSMAAAGPSFADRPRTIDDAPAPVSIYGKSKLAAEGEVRKLSDQLPATILRPPIVFGEADHDGFEMYRVISKLGIHLVPGLSARRFSFIHAEDLAEALFLAAESGKRVSPESSSTDGIYFTAPEQSFTYAEFGLLIGELLHRSTWAIHNPDFAVWIISAINEAIGRLQGKPHILNLDKAREATAPGWHCVDKRLAADVGFQPAKSVRDRLQQTIDWYIDRGWLKTRKTKAAKA